MKFSDIRGCEDTKRVLRRMVDSRKVPHAIMFEEDDGGGAMMLAQAFLQYLYCRGERPQGDSCGECGQCVKTSKMVNPDIHYVFPVNTGTSAPHLAQWRSLVLSNPCFTEAEFRDALDMEGKIPFIKTEEVNSLLEVLSLSALQGGYRATVIYLPEAFQPAAANKLLKMVEEPPAKTVFILITHNSGAVLQTIVSRCLRLRVLPLTKGAEARPARQADAQFEALFADLMECLLRRDAVGAFEVGDAIAALPSREKARDFCAAAGENLRTMFLLRQKGLEALAPDADEKVRRWAAAAKPTFPRKALDAFSRADLMVRRNVNVKILFTDLVGRLMNAI